MLTGHALIAPFLKDKLKKTDSDQCCWCETGKRQTRDHLFKECERWKTEINVLWTTIGEKLGWKHRRNKISELFREEKATGAILQFLRDTDIGKIKNEALRSPIPGCDDDGGSVASDRERRRGREYLVSLL